MNKFLVAGIAAAAFGGMPAIAADMPVRAPVYKAAPAPIFNWTGFYAGIEGGGGWGREHWLDNVINTPPHFKTDGGIFGGQVGYRWQANQFVFGIEGTGAWADLKDTVSGPAGGGTGTETLKVRSLYSVTGQIGYAWDRWLAYAKGGWAEASTRFSASGTTGGGFTASQSSDPHGWTVGGGVDYAVAPNWVFGVEYDHFNLNYKPFTTPVSNGGVPVIVTNTSHLSIDQVVARLSYKFN